MACVIIKLQMMDTRHFINSDRSDDLSKRYKENHS